MTKPLIYGHGAAATVFAFALGFWIAFELVMAVRQRLLVGVRWVRDPSARVLSVCFGGSVLGSLWLGRDGPLLWPGGRTWPLVAGIALMAIGLGLRAWSIATLGRFFQYRIEVQSDHRVVTNGPYRVVRHPSYSGMALVLIGVALATGDVLSLAVVAVFGAVGLGVRINAEERQLTEALGAEYERFAAGRRRVLPGVW